MKIFFGAVAFFVLALPAAAQIPCGPPGVTATVTPAVASPGEVIQVTLTNNSGSTITLASSCVYWGVYPGTGCAGTPTFIRTCPFVLTPIAPGESYTETWTQINDLGQQVPDGTYSFEISGLDPPGACCPTVSIVSPVAVPALPVPAVGVLVGLALLAATWVIRRR